MLSDHEKNRIELRNITSAKDWVSDDDSGNPRNWSLARTIVSTAAVSFLAFVSTFAASIYSPGHDQVAKEFGVSPTVAILPLSLYNFGLAFGPLIGAPLSETFGRKAVFLTTTPIFALFTLGAGFAESLPTLLVCRFFAGVFGSPAISNASAAITDYTAARRRAVPLAFYYSIPFCGAVLAPLVGGFIVQGKGWRWTQWTTLFFAVTFYIPVLFSRETYKRTILQRRAKHFQVEGPPTQNYTILQATQHFMTTLLVRPIHMLFTEPIVAVVCIYNAFQFGLMYTFVVASPWIYQHVYSFGQTAQNLSFLGLVLGTMIAPLPLVLVDTFIYQPQLTVFRQQYPSTSIQFPPKKRLYPTMIGSFSLPISLFIFGWATRPTVHYVCPIFFQGLTILSSILVYSSANLFMIDSYGPLYGASAAGAAMFTRYAFSGVFPLFSIQMYEALGVGWATSLLAFVALAMSPIPWLFWRYSESLRERSRYEMSA